VAVRVRLRVERGGRYVEAVALINSGYEADSPQLMIPIALARELGLWPPPPTAREEVFDTAGGPLRVWVVRNAARAQVLTKDASSKRVMVDLVISPLADEALISDVLASELELVLEDIGRGLWRFKWDPVGKLRMSERRGATTTHNVATLAPRPP